MLSLSLLNNGLSRNFWDEWNNNMSSPHWSEWRQNIASYRETDDGYEFYVNLAGFKKDEVKASIIDGLVSIKAEDKDGHTLSQSFDVPVDGDAEKIDGKLEDGLLTVTVKKIAAPKPQVIKIK